MNDSVPQWQMEEEEEGQDLVGQEVGGGALPLTSVDSLGNSFALWDNEVAELTWENGQLAMHGLGPPKLTASRLAGSRQAWDAGGHPAPNYGTLECIVKQGTLFPVPDKVPEAPQPADLPPWFTDALVPCAPAPVPTPTLGRTGSDRLALDLPPSSNLSTGVSCCPCPYPIYAGHGKKEDRPEAECQNIATVPEVNRLGSSWCISERRETIRSLSGVGSATIGTGYLYTTLDTCGTSDYAGELNTSLRSPENTSTNKDDLVSVSHTTSKREEEESGHRKRKRGCSSISSARRSRAASVHNQSERKRRDRINQKMKVLQKLIPNSSKTDKASILDEVIEYVKQLQATVQMMSQTSMPNMMMPMSIQQLQMCMLVAQMGMGMNTGIRPGHAGIQPFLNPASFMQPNLIPTAAHSSDKLKEMIAGASLPDPISAILACQTRVECQGQLS